MPNHITNCVTITHEDKEKMKWLLDAFKLDEKGCEYFDFHHIIPMPEDLNIENSSNGDLGLELLGVKPRFSLGIEDAKRRFSERSAEDQAEIMALGQKYKDNLEKYGYANWYTWKVAKWGTKWDAYSLQVFTKTEGEISVLFETAWSTPKGIFAELESQGFRINGLWKDEGDDEIHYFNGDPANWYVEHTFKLWE